MHEPALHNTRPHVDRQRHVTAAVLLRFRDETAASLPHHALQRHVHRTESVADHARDGTLAGSRRTNHNDAWN